MAHGLYENDWMLSTKQRPWHGIGTVVQDAPTSEDAIRIAKLNWTVEQFPIYANGKEIAGMFANVRSDTNETLGVVRNRYKIVQNNEAINFVDGIVSNKYIECRYETAGSLFNGKRILTIYDQKDDLQNFKGSAWGFYNATADLISNTLPLRRTSLYEQKKLEKFFDGNKLLNAVQDVLMVA